eukprot:354416-Chlamydomonas_euryale.AAC.8
MSVFITQLTSEQNDPEAPPCQHGIVIKLSWLGCGRLTGELCSAGVLIRALEQGSDQQMHSWVLLQI